MTLHHLHPVDVGSDQIDGISAISETFGIQIITPLADGMIEPRNALEVANVPGVEFTSQFLATAFDAIPLLGTADSFDAHDARVDPDGAKASGSNHQKYSAATALILPRSVQCSQGRYAMASFAAFPYGEDPLTVAKSQALPAYTPPTDAPFHGMGPVTINGAAFTSVNSVSMQFASQVQMDMSDGDVYPKSLANFQMIVTAEIRGLDPAQIDKVLSGSGPYSRAKPIASTTSIKFREYTGDGVFASTAGTLFTFQDGLIAARAVSGAPRELAVVIQARASAANSAVAITTPA